MDDQQAFADNQMPNSPDYQYNQYDEALDDEDENDEYEDVYDDQFQEGEGGEGDLQRMEMEQREYEENGQLDYYSSPTVKSDIPRIDEGNEDSAGEHGD